MCECDNCKLGKRIGDVREYLKDRPDLVDTLDELYSEYIHVSTDLEWLENVVNKRWPNYQGCMKAYGWVEDKKETNDESC
ncbi:hypothetical protein [Escherichia phage vB_EcoM-LTH01]